MPAIKSHRDTFPFGEYAFTVLELMMVLTIISLLTFFSYYFYQDIAQRARDAVRLADMANLQQAISFSIQDSEDKISFTLCNSNTTPCQGSSFPLSNETQKTNGAGWLKINFDKDHTANFKRLPIDPVNDLQFRYAYYSDGLLWKITSKLESQKYKKIMKEDGGVDDDIYEIVVKVGKLKLTKPSV